MDTILYKLNDAIYINLTNRCSNDCTFCVRNTNDGVGGYHLLLEKEPTADEVIALLKAEDDVSKIVFCGLGEPTTAIDVLTCVAKYLKTRGSYIRLNTNGQGSAYAGEDIAPRLQGVIDVVSISLNAPTAGEYQKYCRSIYGEAAFQNLLDFAKECIDEGIDTVLSVVDVIGEEKVEACRAIAEGIGARFRVRTFIE